VKNNGMLSTISRVYLKIFMN